jgi:hypothetical protein
MYKKRRETVHAIINNAPSVTSDELTGIWKEAFLTHLKVLRAWPFHGSKVEVQEVLAEQSVLETRTSKM